MKTLFRLHPYDTGHCLRSPLWPECCLSGPEMKLWIQSACSNMKIVLQPCKVVLLHQKPEGKCFTFWDVTWCYEKVSTDGKPAGTVLKGCEGQRAEAGSSYWTKLSPKLSMPFCFGRKLFTPQDSAGACSVCNRSTRKNTTRTEGLGCFPGAFLSLCSLLESRVLVWVARGRTTDASPLAKPPHNRDTVPIMGNEGMFPWRPVGGIPQGELRNMLSCYPRGTFLEQF